MIFKRKYLQKKLNMLIRSTELKIKRTFVCADINEKYRIY